MVEFFISTLTFLYAGVGIVSAIGYYGTIKELLQKKPSASIPSYAVWTVTSLISLLYGIFVLPDLLFIAVSLLNFVACGVILVLLVRLKYTTIHFAEKGKSDIM